MSPLPPPTTPISGTSGVTPPPPASNDGQPASAARARGLVRPRDGRVFAGVCAGIADRYGWHRRTVRALTLLSVLLPGPQVLIYLVLWLVLPDEADDRRIAGYVDPVNPSTIGA